MIKKFSVTNFKNFKDKTTIDFTLKGKYNWNEEYTNNKLIKNVMLYGKSGSGKSNLSLAMADVYTHLLENASNNEKLYKNYLNADRKQSYAEFEYLIEYNENYDVKYLYRKNDYNKMVFEEMYIGKTLLFQNDYVKKKAVVNDSKISNLNITGLTQNVSTLKYIVSNSNIVDLGKNHPIIYTQRFLSSIFRVTPFGNRELTSLFRYLVDKSVEQDGEITADDIVKDLATEIKRLGIEYKLVYNKRDDDIEVKFNSKNLKFNEVLSSGERALVNFILSHKLIEVVYDIFSSVYDQMVSTEVEVNGKALGLPREITYFQFFDEFDAYYDIVLSCNVLKYICNKDKFQTLITSHNTNLISNKLMRPDCYFIIDDNGIANLPQLTDKEIRVGHSLEKMFIAGEFVFNGEK